MRLLLIEALSAVLLYLNKSGKKRTPKILDIIIGPKNSIKMVQEFIDSESLDKTIPKIENEKNLNLKLEMLQNALGAVLDASTAIDSTKFIHLDIKPSNIMADGTLFDFSTSYFVTNGKRLNDKSYSLNPSDISKGNIGNINVSENKNILAAKKAEDSFVGTPNYAGVKSTMPVSASELVTTDSFSFALTCLDIFDLRDTSRQGLDSIMISATAEMRESYINKVIGGLKDTYSLLFNESEGSADLFYKVINNILTNVLNEMDSSRSIKFSARLIPMLFYALFQCLEIDSISSKWKLNAESLYVVKEVAELMLLPTEEFTNNSTNVQRYYQLIQKEPMYSATKRSLE